MRKIVFLIFIFSTACQFAFSQGSKRVGYRKDVFESNSWIGKDSSTLAYNLDTLLINQQNWKYGIGNTWDNNFKYLFQYNAAKKMTEQIRQNWNGTSWVNHSQYKYAYDANNNNTLVEYNVWNGSIWSPVGKIEYVNYNSFGKFGGENVYNWNGSSWANSTYSVLTYVTATPKLQSFENYYWDNATGWKKDQRNYYTYNQDSVSSITYTKPNANNQWEIEKKFVYTYQSTPMRLTEILRQTVYKDTLGTPQFLDSLRTTLTYNLNSQLEKSETKKYDSTSNIWQDYTRTQHVFNGLNQVSEEIVETNVLGVWNNTSKSMFQYLNGNVSDEMQYIGNNNAWDLARKYLFSYNSNNDMTFKQEELFNGNFVPSYREFYYYLNTLLSNHTLQKALTELLIYPNPADQNVHVKFVCDEPFVATLQLVNFQGQTVMVVAQPVQVGIQTIEMPIAKVSAGNYVLNVLHASKGLQGSLKFVVK